MKWISAGSKLIEISEAKEIKKYRENPYSYSSDYKYHILIDGTSVYNNSDKEERDKEFDKIKRKLVD